MVEKAAVSFQGTPFSSAARRFTWPVNRSISCTHSVSLLTLDKDFVGVRARAMHGRFAIQGSVNYPSAVAGQRWINSQLSAVRLLAYNLDLLVEHLSGKPIDRYVHTATLLAFKSSLSQVAGAREASHCPNDSLLSCDRLPARIPSTLMSSSKRGQ
jgi:hypothetical protein